MPKQKYKVSNWSEYNKVLRMRSNIEIWISLGAINNWYEQNRIYNGAGAPKKFSDYTIRTCHEIRQVYHLPLRQCQGFIDSIFGLKGLPISRPDYSCLSKRLSMLKIKSPRYRNTDKTNNNIVAIAIDSTGLKRFGRDEWRQEKYKISGNRSWRKLHIGVGCTHIIQVAELTDRFASYSKMVDTLANQIDIEINSVTADGSYDKIPVYETLLDNCPYADIVIPPASNTFYKKENYWQRNRTLWEIKTFGRMGWQRARDYGKRNYSELAIQRYKRILGRSLHARELARQKNEAMIGCGILNKMTSIGMPESYRTRI